MTYPYVVTLKNRQTRLLDLIGLLLSLLSVSAFLREILSGQQASLALPVGALGVTVVVVWNLFQALRKRKKVYYSRGLLLAALVWMKMPYAQWLSLVFILLALLEYQAKYSVEIGFAEDEVVINTFFKKRLPWRGFTLIVLKDGVLTLDFVSNKVWQFEVEEDDEPDADEDEFNEWCRSKVQSHREPTASQTKAESGRLAR